MKVRAKAPLRLGLAGGGTDLSPYCDIYGGVVLNVTINLYAHTTIETLSENKVVFEAVDINESYECDLIDCIEISGSLLLHKGVYNRIVKEFNNGMPLCIKVITYSDAPPGSGLGSSSAMVVSTLKAYVELLKLPLGEYDIAKLAYEIERIDLKLSGGKQDQYAATFGGFNFMEFYENNRVIVNPLRIRRWFVDELEESLVLYYTGKSRDSAQIIDNQIKAVSGSVNNLEAMHKVKEYTYKMKEAVLLGNINMLAAVLNEAWIAKKMTSSNISNSKIDKIYDEAINAGALAGKISGAGGGGFMIFIVDPVKKLNVIKVLETLEGKVINVTFTENGTKGWYL